MISRYLIMSGSWVAVLLCTTFFVVAISIVMVPCRRSGKFSTGLVAAGAAPPSVVVWVTAGRLDACSAELLSKVGDVNMKFGLVLQGDEDLGVGGSAVYGECTVGRSEIFY